MPSTINATSTGSGGLISTGDASGQLELQTNSSTRLTINSSGNATFAGNLTVNGTLSATSGLPSLATPLAVVGNATAGSEIRLPEDTDNGSNYVALKAADNLASNVTFTLPSADGTSGQVLQTNGSGTLSFATPASGALVYISSQTASSSAALAFTGIGSTYDMYVFELINVKPATDGQELRIRTSTNNGSSYDAGATDYTTQSAYWDFTATGGSTGYISTNGTFIQANGNSLGNDVNENGLSGFVYVVKPSAAQYCLMLINTVGMNTSTKNGCCFGCGQRSTAADVDAIQFSMTTGNIASGTIRLYGIANS